MVYVGVNYNILRLKRFLHQGFLSLWHNISIFTLNRKNYYISKGPYVKIVVAQHTLEFLAI